MWRRCLRVNVGGCVRSQPFPDDAAPQPLQDDGPRQGDVCEARHPLPEQADACRVLRHHQVGETLAVVRVS